MSLTVKQLAEIAHVSVRTLHHYDRIGLLEPSARTDAGYRLYEHRDLERLQEVLFFRELGFSLADIAEVLNDPRAGRLGALERLRDGLKDRGERLTAMVESVERAIQHERTGVSMDREEMFEVFGDFDPEEHAEEARERWGDTDAYRVSARRTARYGKREWAEIKAEGEAVDSGLAALMDEGVPATDLRAMDLAESHRLQIDRWFYPCSPEMHVGLGEMYVADARFTAHYDKVREGLADYLRDAIRANAERASSG